RKPECGRRPVGGVAGRPQQRGGAQKLPAERHLHDQLRRGAPRRPPQVPEFRRGRADSDRPTPQLSPASTGQLSCMACLPGEGTMKKVASLTVAPAMAGCSATSMKTLDAMEPRALRSSDVMPSKA